MWDSNFLNLLKTRITLSDVIGKSVKLIQRGRAKVARCPFHSEKTPSFQVNDEKGFYHCFGCGAHGDVFDFLMRRDGLDFSGAVKMLAEENGLELPRSSPQEEERHRIAREESEIIQSINESSCAFFQSCLLSPEGGGGLDYVKGRGLGQADMKKFRIGFAPNSYSRLLGHLRDLGFGEEEMLRAGVVAKNERSPFDRFRNRVMFPVFGDSGKVIAFSGRVIEKGAMPKYMNSPETPLYHKGDVLFNYFFAKRAIVTTRQALLVEGNMDALSLHSRGIENVVSPLGTAVTQQQIDKLWKVADEIIVCFDGDEAGQKASKRLALMVLATIGADKSLRILSLPENRDPDEMIRLSGREYFLDYLRDGKNSMALSEFLWASELREVGLSPDGLALVPEQKNRLEMALDRIIGEIGNRIVRKNFRNFYSNRLFLLGRGKSPGKSGNGGDRALNYRGVTNIDPGKSTVPPNSIENMKNSIRNIEKYMFYLLIGDLGLVEKIFQNYNVDVFAINFLRPDAAALVGALAEASGECGASDKSSLAAILEKNGLEDYLRGSSGFGVGPGGNGLDHLYSLVLERSALVLEIEIRELALLNNNEERRKVLLRELELLNGRRAALEGKFLQ
ncbi:MAG: DNA primase [Rickettsiales bacterium]|jgi:DNA primase|nr:DNA primase [Rickettsiales bacterium]